MAASLDSPDSPVLNASLVLAGVRSLTRSAAALRPKNRLLTRSTSDSIAAVSRYDRATRQGPLRKHQNATAPREPVIRTTSDETGLKVLRSALEQQPQSFLR